MKKRILIGLLFSGFLFVGIWALFFKDYVNILVYPEQSSKIYLSRDSITIAPYFFVKDFNTLGAAINIEHLDDSLVIQELDVSVYSTDRPGQSVQLDYVSAVVHPVIIVDDHLVRVKADNFKGLSDHDKKVTNGGLPYNSFSFFFRTWFIWNTDFYQFKINGKILYKGQVYNFEKDSKTNCVREYRPYRMMT